MLTLDSAQLKTVRACNVFHVCIDSEHLWLCNMISSYRWKKRERQTECVCGGLVGDLMGDVSGVSFLGGKATKKVFFSVFFFENVPFYLSDYQTPQQQLNPPLHIHRHTHVPTVSSGGNLYQTTVYPCWSCGLLSQLGEQAAQVYIPP